MQKFTLLFFLLCPFLFPYLAQATPIKDIKYLYALANTSKNILHKKICAEKIHEINKKFYDRLSIKTLKPSEQKLFFLSQTMWQSIFIITDTIHKIYAHPNTDMLEPYLYAVTCIKTNPAFLSLTQNPYQLILFEHLNGQAETLKKTITLDHKSQDHLSSIDKTKSVFYDWFYNLLKINAQTIYHLLEADPKSKTTKQYTLDWITHLKKIPLDGITLEILSADDDLLIIVMLGIEIFNHSYHALHLMNPIKIHLSTQIHYNWENIQNPQHIYSTLHIMHGLDALKELIDHLHEQMPPTAIIHKRNQLMKDLKSIKKNWIHIQKNTTENNSNFLREANHTYIKAYRHTLKEALESKIIEEYTAIQCFKEYLAAIYEHKKGIKFQAIHEHHIFLNDLLNQLIEFPHNKKKKWIKEIANDFCQNHYYDEAINIRLNSNTAYLELFGNVF